MRRYNSEPIVYSGTPLPLAAEYSLLLSLGLAFLKFSTFFQKWPQGIPYLASLRSPYSRKDAKTYMF